MLVAAIVIALATGAAQVTGRLAPKSPRAVILYVLAASAAVATAVLRHLSTSRAADREWVDTATAWLALPPDPTGALPPLSTLSGYQLGVAESPYSSAKDGSSTEDPYVPRDAPDDNVEERLDEALGSARFILVVGPAKAGKSRTAFESARRLLAHDPAVLVPRKTADIEALLKLDPPLDLLPAPALVWLDDIDETALAELTPAVLARLAEVAIIVGTITSNRRDRVEGSTSDIAAPARRALRSATTVYLRSELRGQEKATAERAYPNERFAHGIGETLVAAPEFIRRYQDAYDSCPEGWAVLQAGIDWRRIGVGRNVHREELRALFPNYLRVVRPTREATDEMFAAGLDWATTPVASHLAPLGRTDDGAYRAFDVLVEVADGRGSH